MRRIIPILAALAVLGGCVERAPELAPADRERLREFVGTTAPSPTHELNVQFDNGVRLLGYDVTSESVTAGQPVTITWYWHSAQNMDDGWQVFTHIADASGENRLNQDRVGTVRELYQPGRWEAGQYIRDVQEVTLPADWNSPEAVFYLGLWNGPHRLAIHRGPNDGDNRVRALSLDVSSPPSAAADPAEAPAARRGTPPPSLRAPKTEAAIVVDGNLDEAAWASAGRTQPFVNTMTGGAAPFRATARTLWDDEHLYVAFEVADDFVQSTLEGRDAHLWEQDAVEIMVDPGGDGRNYFELQVSPTGVAFDTRYDTRRQPQPFGHVDWNAELVARVNVRGTANDDEEDQGYTAEIAIPWAAFATGEPPATRPAVDDSWRVNFYVMDQRRGEEADRAAGWSPPLTGDFHVPSRFGTVTFAGPSQPIAAAAPALPVGDPDAPRIVDPAVQLRPSAVRALREQIGARRQPVDRALRARTKATR